MSKTSVTRHILDDVESLLRRFIAYPNEHAPVAHALWIAHCHLIDAFDTSPRLAFLSPEPGSGKSRALEVTAKLVPRPVESVNSSPAYLIRIIGQGVELPTILYDEIDAVFGPKAGGNEELRALFNAGHRRGAKAGRCVTIRNKVETEELPAFCPVAVGGLGNLPDTIMSRTVAIRMRVRRPDEPIQTFRLRDMTNELAGLMERLEWWARDHLEDAADMRPKLPDAISDRAADVWEPLIICADLAGGDWPQRARAAALGFIAAARESSPSLGVQLLADCRQVFGEDAELHTSRLLERLVALEEAPWADMRGQPLSPRKLGFMLSQYGIRSENIRLHTQAKGYRKVSFADAWARYLK